MRRTRPLGRCRTLAWRRALVLAAVLLLVSCADAAPSPVSSEPLSGPALTEALGGGGYVLFIRHTTSDSSHDQGAPPQVTDCGRQRNLSAAGRAEAEHLGTAMAEVGVAVGEVRASPFCRTVDTATLAFGTVIEEDRLLQGDSQAAAEALAGLLSEQPQQGNTVLIGHVGNLGAAADLHIAEGETAVFAPGGDGEFTLVATVPLDAWAELSTGQ